MSKEKSGKNAVKKSDMQTPAIQKPRLDYAPRQKPAYECIELPEILLKGWVGVTVIEGVKFGVTKDKLKNEHEHKIIHVLEAPLGTELFGLSRSPIYLTVNQADADEFYSKLPKASKGWEVQERIWNFLHCYFVKEGIKKAPTDKTAKFAEGTVMHTSVSVEDFVSGVHGLYRLNPDRKEIFEVKEVPVLFKKTGKTQNILRVKVILFEKGHPLDGYTRPDTWFPHKLLFQKKTPHFFGGRAGDMFAMWDYLSGMVAKHWDQVLRVDPAFLPSKKQPTVDYQGHA